MIFMLHFARRIYAFKSLYGLNLFSFYCARKWGMAFINCFTHHFLLWQESESTSKCQTSQLCLIIIYAKLFHMFWTKKKKTCIKNIYYWKVTKKWKVVIVSYHTVLGDFRSKQITVSQISGIFRCNTLLQVHLSFSQCSHCLYPTECLSAMCLKLYFINNSS